MRTFFDQTGGLWAKGALHGKIASVFTSTGTGGGQEMTITSTWTTLAHHGMILLPIGYGTKELADIEHGKGGTPYGASTIAGGDGSRQPDARERAIAKRRGEGDERSRTREEQKRHERDRAQRQHVHDALALV